MRSVRVFNASIINLLKENFTVQIPKTKDSDALMIKRLMIMKADEVFVSVAEEDGKIHGFIIAQAVLGLQIGWVHQLWSGFRCTGKWNRIGLRAVMKWLFEDFNILRLRSGTELRHDIAMEHLGWKKVLTIREYLYGAE